LKNSAQVKKEGRGGKLREGDEKKKIGPFNGVRRGPRGAKRGGGRAIQVRKKLSEIPPAPNKST